MKEFITRGRCPRHLIAPSLAARISPPPAPVSPRPEFSECRAKTETSAGTRRRDSEITAAVTWKASRLASCYSLSSRIASPRRLTRAIYSVSYKVFVAFRASLLDRSICLAIHRFLPTIIEAADGRRRANQRTPRSATGPARYLIN